MEKLKMLDKDYGALALMLRRADFFSSFTIEQLDMVLPYILLYDCKKGETIFRQGDAGDAFYIVYEGSVRVKIKRSFLGFSKTVSTLGPGNFFGEMALLSKQARNATLQAAEPSKLFVLLTRDFEYICRQKPAFAVEVNRLAARRKFADDHDR